MLASSEVNSRVIFHRYDPLSGFLNVSGAGGAGGHVAAFSSPVSDRMTTLCRDGGCFLELIPRGGTLIFGILAPIRQASRSQY